MQKSTTLVQNFFFSRLQKTTLYKSTLKERYYKIHYCKILSLSHWLLTFLSIPSHFNGLLPHSPQRGSYYPFLRVCSQILKSYFRGVGVLNALSLTQLMFSKAFSLIIAFCFQGTQRKKNEIMSSFFSLLILQLSSHSPPCLSILLFVTF